MGSPIAMSAPLALAADCSNATAAAAAQRTGGLAAAAQQAELAPGAPAGDAKVATRR